MRKIFVLLFALTMFTVFSACGSSSSTSPSATNASLVNTWKLTSDNGAAPNWTEILILNVDNTFSAAATFSNSSSCTLTGTYSINGNIVTSTVIATSNSSLCPIVNPTTSYSYSISGNDLTFTNTSNNNVSVYQKQ